MAHHMRKINSKTNLLCTDWVWRSRPYMFGGITETKRSQLQCRLWVASLYHYTVLCDCL
jgi:hypothetical protein